MMVVRTLCLLFFLLALFGVSNATSNGQTLGLLDSETALAEVACVQRTCSGFRCPAGYVAVSADTICGRNSCDQCSCCKKTQNCGAWYSTSTTKCPAGSRLMANANNRYCNRTTCATSECCETLPTCRNYNCGSDTRKADNTVCPTGACTHTDCCTCSPKCDNFNCAGRPKKSGRTTCPSTGCTLDACCERPLYCNTYRCSKGALKPGAERIQCSRGACSDCDCCEEKTCANFQCGTNFMLKSGATSIKCPTGTCDQARCCDATCPTYQCPAGYRRNTLATSIRLCPPAGTTDNDDGDHNDHGDRDGGDHGDHDGGDHDGSSGGGSYGGRGDDRLDADNSGNGLGSHFRDGRDPHDLPNCRMFNCGRDIPIYPSPYCGRGACSHFECCLRVYGDRDHGDHDGGDGHGGRRACDRDHGDRSDHGDHDGGDHDGGDRDGGDLGDHDGGDHDGGDNDDGHYGGFLQTGAQDGSDTDGGDTDGGDTDGGDTDGGDRDGGDHNDNDDDCDSRTRPTPCNDVTNCCVRNTCGDTPTGRAYACPAGSTLILDAMTKNCAGDCTQTECCKPSCAVCTATFDCRTSGQAFNAAKINVRCSGTVCTVEECCLPLCNTPGKNPCTADRPTIASPGSMRCRSSTCTPDECCIKTCASSNIRCGATQAQVSNYATKPCPRATGDQFGTCLTPSTDCCVNTCTGYQCPAQTSPKQNAGNCASTCQNGDCCTPNLCPANYPCGPGTRPRPNMATLPCDVSTCRNNECCIQNVCSDSAAFPGGCPSGYQRKAGFNTQTCGVGSSCRLEDCCNQVCPSSGLCNPGSEKPVTGMVVCASSICTRGECCVPTTCSDYTCSGTSVRRAGQDSAVCSGTACQATCCAALGVCFQAGGFENCPAGSRPRRESEALQCGLVCTERDCCIRTCDSYTCKTGRIRTDASTRDCVRATPNDVGTCSDDICCYPTCASTGHVCTTGQVQTANYNTMDCSETCRDSDCCRDTCTLFTCPDYYHPLTSAGSRVCNRNEATCRDICCALTVCSTDASFCGANYHLKEGQPGCQGACTRDECCNPDSCFGTFQCVGAEGWLPRNDNPSCGGQPCTNERCCVHKTCDRYGGCLGGGWDYAPDMSTRLCATSTCTDAECCVPVCNLADTNFCGSGKQFKMSKDIIHCQSSPCAIDECCDVRTCAITGYQCQQPRHQLRENLATLVCAGSCNDDDCCELIPDRCFDKTGGVPECQGGLAPKPAGELPERCPEDLCIPSDCCVPTCASYPCTVYKDVAMVCPGGECSEELCCQKFCRDTSVCATTDIVRDIPCENCDHATCCQPTCDSVNCEAGYQKKVTDMFPCDECSNDVCCTKVVCGDYRCPARWHPKESFAAIWCESGTCTDSDCCAPNTCAAYECPAGKENLDRSMPCAAVPCTEQECCTDITCDGVKYECAPPLFRQPTLVGCAARPCTDRECCRPKCTAAICLASNGRHLRSGAADRLCDGMACTDAECCEDLTCGNSGFTCPARPGNTVTPAPPSTVCPGDSCSTQNQFNAQCCLYRALPGCFGAGSNILQCDAGWIQKATPLASCPEAGCQITDCCTRTCALDAASLCVSRPPKLNLVSIPCPNGVCSEDDCCDYYCDPENLRCGLNAKVRPDASTTICRGSCTNSLCCVPKTCDDYTCPSDTTQNTGMQCVGGACSESLCCKRTCATYQCGSGYTRFDPTVVCPGGVCSASTCCAVTCGNFSCCSGYDARPDGATTFCQGGACSLAQCCIPNCAAPTFSCNTGSVKKSNPESISCTTTAGISTSLGYTGYICLQSRCCDSVCTTSTCSSSQRLKEGMLNQPCTTTGTSCQDYCCEAKTCANQNVQCDAPTWRRKADYAVITCSTCSANSCCEKIPYYCSAANCNAGWTPKSDASTMLCPDQQCTNAYCCLPTCTTVSCSALGRPTMSGSATHVCGATGCTSDECCGQYCSGAVCTTPGYVLRAPAPACASLPCQEDECCVRTCATYTCTGADKALMNNPQSQSCTSAAGCNDDLCCVTKQCPSCGAGYSPRGLMSCTTCTRDECCTQNTCTNKAVVCDSAHQLIVPSPTCVACTQGECCEPICTAAVCGADHRYEPTQTRCSADPCPMNDAICCKPNVCGAFPCGSLQTNKPASTTCSGWPCRRDECCLQTDVFCFDANSLIKSCTNGRVAKTDASSRKCSNQECTEGVCCDETCASAPSNICGARPRLPTLASHRCSNQNVVGVSGQTANGCLADECCGQYCSTDTSLRCPVNTALRDDSASSICAGAACTTRECCQDLCKTIACDVNDHMVDPNKACPAGSGCTKPYCCATTTCANNVDLRRFTCPAGWVPRPGTNAEDILCMGECNTQICCIPVTCPSSFVCASGTTPKASMTSQPCTTGVCLNGDCCELSCKGWLPSNACPVGSRPRFDMNTSDLACAGGQCSSTICCIQNTCANPEGNGVAFTCAAPLWSPRSDFATAICTSAHCVERDCCVPLCGANPQCNAGYVPKNSSMTTPCLSGTCSNDVCCTRKMCPSTYTCGSTLYVPKPNLATIPCAGSTCVDRDCCRDQCANIVCDAGYKKNSNQYCAGIPCTNAECCVTQAQCPSTYQCTQHAGDVLKHLPQYCAGSTCTYTECCCTGGCNYCGTQFAASRCPVGSKLMLGQSCGAATCTADICCIGTCQNYPCSNGPSDPSLINALCNNPKQCIEADCCIQWGD